LPGGRVVTGLHVGPYDSVGHTYARMTAWAIAHGLHPTQDMWEVYLTDPEREPDPARWRTGLFLRVE
jgi:effector-binding domain-containing protein